MTRDRASWIGCVLLAVVIAIVLAGWPKRRRAAAAVRPRPRTTCSPPPGLQVIWLKLLKVWPILKPSPPQEIVKHNYQGTNRFLVCTDQNSKACYVGDEAAFQRHQNLANQEILPPESVT